MARDCVDFLPARMDRRVGIQSEAKTADGQGGWTSAWSTDAEVWAYVRPLKGYERMQAMHLKSPTTHKVTIRYRDGVTAAQRLLYGSRVLHINGVVNPDEANRFLELLCVEV
jgi:SPP1 family predicted phage head-tail adaptor